MELVLPALAFSATPWEPITGRLVVLSLWALTIAELRDPPKAEPPAEPSDVKPVAIGGSASAIRKCSGRWSLY